jgi:hypothetical protein
MVAAWLTRSGSAGGENVTIGLSGVGSPPVTRRSHVPRNFRTTDVPPYSR